MSKEFIPDHALEKWEAVYRQHAPQGWRWGMRRAWLSATELGLEPRDRNPSLPSAGRCFSKHELVLVWELIGLIYCILSLVIHFHFCFILLYPLLAITDHQLCTKHWMLSTAPGMGHGPGLYWRQMAGDVSHWVCGQCAGGLGLLPHVPSIPSR